MSVGVLTEPAAPGDEALLRDFRAGNRGAGDELYRRYAGRVIALARGKMSRGLAACMEADDVAQSVFRRFFDAARQGRYALPSDQELWDLLLVITLNRVRSLEHFHRTGKRDLRQTVALDDESPADRPQRGESLQTLLAMAVDEAVEALPHHSREVVRLRMDGYEVAEIALKTRRSKRSVERLLQETRQRLQTLLQLEWDHDPGGRADRDRP